MQKIMISSTFYVLFFYRMISSTQRLVHKHTHFTLMSECTVTTMQKLCTYYQ